MKNRLILFSSENCTACPEVEDLVKEKLKELGFKLEIFKMTENNTTQIRNEMLKYHVSSFPSLIVLDSNNKPLQVLIGNKGVLDLIYKHFKVV